MIIFGNLNSIVSWSLASQTYWLEIIHFQWEPIINGYLYSSSVWDQFWNGLSKIARASQPKKRGCKNVIKNMWDKTNQSWDNEDMVRE